MSDTGERLARLETTLAHTLHQSEKNGARSEEILSLVLDKIDHLDKKIEDRFNKIEEHAKADAAELQMLKNRGIGVLAALGFVFSATATLFADWFLQIKHAIFG